MNINKIFKIIYIIFVIFFITHPLLANASEVKIGLVRSPQKNERGSNINLEYIGNVISEKYTLYPFVGLSYNLQGFTSSLHTGLVWKKNLKDDFFIEASLGFAVHNGPLKRKAKQKQKGRIFGSRILFRESFAIGYLFTNNNNISLFIDHISNANLFPPNHGLTNLGIRYGINF